MPDLDGGHYFFTAIVPIRNVGVVEHAVHVGGKRKMKSSPIHVLRETLETLPTALQSHATQEIGIQSPFARSLRTHFARFVVFDQPYYNGRDPQNAFVQTIAGTDLLTPQPQDEVSCPYLMVMIDFDPATPDAKGEPRGYFEELWRLMPDELTAVFRYCYGFPDKPDAASFAEFILPCQIESVMTFNDYYTGAPPLKSLSIAALALPPVAALAIGLLGDFVWHWWSGWGTAAVTLGLLILAVLGDYRFVSWKGMQPFPANPDATLRHVLKGLYLQQAFVRFALRQGDDQTARGAAFRAFLRDARPDDLDGPTQPPGVIRSSFGAAS